MKLSFRMTNFIMLIIIACLVGFSFYLEFGKDIEPCLLCLTQRILFIGLGLFLLLAIIFAFSKMLRFIFTGLAFIFTLLGILASGRQIWLQHLPAANHETCLPGAMFIIKNFPLKEVVRLTISGTGECARINWTFLNLSMSEWSCIFFVIFLIVLIFQFRKKN